MCEGILRHWGRSFLTGLEHNLAAMTTAAKGGEGVNYESYYETVGQKEICVRAG